MATDWPETVSADALVGRRAESEAIAAFLAEVATRGGALLLSGEPGVGKTALLRAAAATASATGFTVLEAAGVQFEADLSFAGLHRTLASLKELERLPAVHRDALKAAMGLVDGSGSELLLISAAALALVRLVADTRPVLLLVDDPQWLDAASAKVFGFVARRLSGIRVGLLAASRAGAESFLSGVDLAERIVPALDGAAAAELVERRFPDLAPQVRRRLLADAQGNPLALMELPTQLTTAQASALRALPSVLPLSRHLQAAFAHRVGDLSEKNSQLPAPCSIGRVRGSTSAAHRRAGGMWTR